MSREMILGRDIARERSVDFDDISKVHSSVKRQFLIAKISATVDKARYALNIFGQIINLQDLGKTDLSRLSGL